MDTNTETKNASETERREWIQERLELSKERLTSLHQEMSDTAEGKLPAPYADYLHRTSGWLLHLFEIRRLLEEEQLLNLPLEELETLNYKHYEELLPAGYEKSYANPAYAVSVFGRETGQFFSALSAELRQGLSAVYEGRMEELAAAAELFLETAGNLTGTYAETGQMPAVEELRQILYWYYSDYVRLRSERQVQDKVAPQEHRVRKLVMQSDFSDLRYLYGYGKYISEDEKRTAAFLQGLPQETIDIMADTFTEGYRIGFQVTNKALCKKKTAELRYHIGFERVVKKAVENFKRMGLETILSPGNVETTPANRQYLYDHRDDGMLYFDRQYSNRKLEAMQLAFEARKEAARGYAGPAVMEVFGEEPFSPVVKKEAIAGDEKYQKRMVEYTSAYRQMQAAYIIEEERSYTIIAFPTPAVGEPYAEIFKEIIRINTLDYKKYQQIQQVLIDTLDKAQYAVIRGTGENGTNLKVMLHPLKNPAKETKFENCVADVNIPVGEVFTSPVLSGTDGVLQVKRVFLNGLEYRNLEIIFKDGLVADYRCSNFPTQKEGKQYIRDNVLFHHETLPMGEFAIGTNTSAYVTAMKYDIGAKLPILIAEKMGPHFALGDTCYSHAEDVKVYNPDGKEIIARDNEVSLLRKTDSQKAYFNCHTDITIPYHELGELTAVEEDGTRHVIIRDGRFVLQGCEELNVPLDLFRQNMK